MVFDEIINKHLKSKEEIKEFLEYTTNKFTVKRNVGKEVGDVFENRWNEILRFSKIFGAAGALNTLICPKRKVEFEDPDSVKIEMYDSFCGKIMILSIANTADFEAFITNAVYKGIRPKHLSQTGAAFISGASTRLIALSAKPYSNLPAAEVGLSDSEWAQKSLLLRRGHECTHYYTKRFYGKSENNLHDELMADFFGVYEAFGYFKAELILRFFGLIKGSGGRLQFYINSLSENTQNAVREIAWICAENLERWSQSQQFAAMTREERTEILCRAGLSGIYSAKI